MKTKSVRTNILIYDLIFVNLFVNRSRDKGDYEQGQEERKRLRSKETKKGKRKRCDKETEKRRNVTYLWKVSVASTPKPLVPLTHCQPAN